MLLKADICYFLVSFVLVFHQRVPNLIGGAFVDSKSPASIDVINPVSIRLSPAYFYVPLNL